MPRAIIIGAQKCGTKSLYFYMKQHPDLFGPTRKEVHYFDGGLDPSRDTYALGENWYRSHFPIDSALTAGAVVFEASPMYLFHPLAAARIAETIPDVRLIVLVRDPVERAISHYFHNCEKHKEPLSLEDAFAAEEERLQACGGDGLYKEEAYNRYSYRARGRYLEQIERYLEVFERDQIRLIHTGDLHKDPHGTLRDTFAFVGVDPNFQVADLTRRNVGATRSELSHSLRSEMRDYFRPYNAALFEFLGVDYGWNA